MNKLTAINESKPAPFVRAICLFIFLLSGISTGFAEQALTTEQGAFSLAFLQQKKASINADSSLDESLKATALSHYDMAIVNKKSTLELVAELVSFEAQLVDAPKRITDIQDALVNSFKSPADFDNSSTENDVIKLETALMTAEAEHRQQLAKQKKHAQVLSELLATKGKGHGSINDLKKRLDSAKQSLAETPDVDNNVLSEARHTNLAIKKALYETQLQHYLFVLEKQDVLVQLHTLERDLASRRLTQLQTHTDLLKVKLQQQRENKAAEVSEQAEILQQSVADLPIAVRVIADDNVTFGNELQDVTLKQAQTTERLNASSQALDELIQQVEEARKRVELVGNSEAIGRMLRNRATALPSIHSYQAGAKKRRNEIDRVTDRLIDINERRRALLNIEQRIEKTLADVEEQKIAQPPSAFATSKDDDRTRLSQLVRSLLTIQFNNLTKLSETYNRYISDLTSLDTARRQLVLEAQQFSSFINERLLWIKSIPVIGVEDGAHFINAIAWLTSTNNWQPLINNLSLTIQAKPWLALIALMLLVGGFFLQKFCKKRLREIAKQTIKIRFDSIKLSFKALIYTALLAAVWPLLLYFIAWQLSVLPATTFSLALAGGLQAASTMLLIISFIRYSCLEYGLAGRHFRWPVPIYQGLLSHTKWLKIIMPTLVLIMTVSMHPPESFLTQGLARPAFMSLMVTFIIFIYHLLGPSSTLQCFLRKKAGNESLKQVAYFWLPLALFLPLAMMVAAAAGYQHTALVVMQHVRTMIVFFFGLMVLHALLLRALYIAEKQFRYREAVKKRKENYALKQKEGHVEKKSSSESTLDIEVQDIDYSELSEQAKKLIRTGLVLAGLIALWFVWTDLLPIFNVLDSISLPFSTTQLVDGIEKLTPLTLQDVALAILFLLVTVTAAKNVPGLLEIILLQRLNIDAGSRYAIKTLSQYFIVSTGVILVFNAIGAEWSSIQWLVAALSVGLGFGLQEIVANFISGIIILFER
ncbi:MAG: mechanosensitive ion channel, partial [Cycloclasticus sp.]|nr:mechanosensitive ion channel [Cycloclasticus sp.]